MATRRAWSILVGEMVAGAYTKQYSITSCLRRRCTIDWLGIGRLLLSLFPSISPKAALPSPPESPLRATVSHQATSGGWALVRSRAPLREGGDG